ncbi:MAG: STAS domain-containing protein [Pseudomonadota bacterium]|nr:STAS domain-containing protein [Pseudomonadota bacterium]
MTASVEPGFELARSPGKLNVEGVLSFDTAAMALKAIQAAMAGGGVGELDLGGVSHCDSAGLACVLAVAAEADKRGNALRITHIPAGMQALAQVCEVDRLIA